MCQWNGSDRGYGNNDGGGSTVMAVLVHALRAVVIGMVGAVVEVLMAYKC